MILKSVSVLGLFGSKPEVNYIFNDDLNIITGRNGSGKTTIMKLAWFIVSGNILNALREIEFRSVTVETDLYKCSVFRTGPLTCRIELTTRKGTKTYEDSEVFDGDRDFFTPPKAAEDQVNPILRNEGGSIFFPTFRRIEGGFSMQQSTSSNRSRPWAIAEAEIDDILSSLSRRLTNKNHVFVSAISTEDVVSLLRKRFSEFSEEINKYQAKISKNVIDKIKVYQREESNREYADTLLSETREEIEKIESFRSEKMRPFDAVTKLVENLFQHSGISFGPRLNFGDAAEAVNSDVLSAGEKQMLSFICYNAFTNDSIIFIDEPELSLHVDWQRRLYPILHKQNPKNQFIFATHSPFIYGKYPDKEVALSADRGASDV
ncbi:AAA family ATPase [Komagataeibacter europaeus]|uniref:AAA family ATPase n=1 Tax=Komagataeibacter europaeus TaxID=33995 RepID=UPI000B3EB7F7|nr:ATP-binding protein [Komagataeibacter europaeus]ARW15997.1 hypothetical protein S101446_00857 [Komagataeibacter europaeus]